MPATTAPKLHDLNIDDPIRATFNGPWWTGRTLTIVGFRCDYDIADVRDNHGNHVMVPANLLARI